MRDWLFNTNESYGKGAFNQMMAKSVIAVYGYPPGIGEQKLQRPQKGDRVFAYVNERGIISAGTFIDKVVVQSSGVFAPNAQREFIRKIKWTCVVNPQRAVTYDTIRSWGYRLPVRCTVGKISDESIGNKIEKELVRRGDDRL